MKAAATLMKNHAMYVIVDKRAPVALALASQFRREGVALVGIDPAEFRDWLRAVADQDLDAIDAFLIGEGDERQALPKLIRRRSPAPVLYLSDRPSLAETLSLFKAGADDVIGSRVDPREIMARVGAIGRRAREENAEHVAVGKLKIFFDGRLPEFDGAPYPLPRREQRILEYLARNRNRRVSKSQIFNAVYGLFDDAVDENVVESHICKLRKKLKGSLGYDPIDTQRYLGYLLVEDDEPASAPPARAPLVVTPPALRIAV
jgi:DNA-binding response OmpR family regulator